MTQVVASRRQGLEGTVLDNPFPYLSKPSALAYCGAKKPKEKAEGLPGIFTKVILGN